MVEPPFTEPGEPSIGFSLAFHLDQLRSELANRPVRTRVQAAEAVSPGQVGAVVSSGLVLADRTDLDHAGKVLGVVTVGAAVGQNAEVQLVGGLEGVITGHAPGVQLFLGLGGALTDALPQDGFQQEVAVALTATLVVVNLGVPIVLA